MEIEADQNDMYSDLGERIRSYSVKLTIYWKIIGIISLCLSSRSYDSQDTYNSSDPLDNVIMSKRYI